MPEILSFVSAQPDNYDDDDDDGDDDDGDDGDDDDARGMEYW